MDTIIRQKCGERKNIVGHRCSTVYTEVFNYPFACCLLRKQTFCFKSLLNVLQMSFFTIGFVIL